MFTRELERKRREIVLIIEVNTNVVDTFGF